MKNWAQWAQQQNWAQGSPAGTGTAFLIGKKLISLAPHKRSPASSRFPWGAKTSQMGVLYPATPEIYNFLPESRPTSPRVSAPPDHCFGHCLHRFTCAPNCYPTALLYNPALSSGTLGKPTILPAYPKSLLLILTSPGTTATLCFLDWWGIPGVDLWSKSGKSGVFMYQGTVSRCVVPALGNNS